MNHAEHALLFDCASQPTVGILSLPAAQRPTLGLLVIVGGPQYRIGSHRQFVLMARHVAAQGFAAMRFDCRGMGDSWDAQRSFEDIEDDIASAVGSFFREVPSLERVILWGLCDGASAACLYAPRDPRIGGLILVNPWVHTPAGASATMLKHYYLKRLVSRAFWLKLASGRVSASASMSALSDTLRQYLGRRSTGAKPADDTDSSTPLPQRMARRLRASGLPVAVALSEDDRVAREFEELAMPTPAWRAVLSKQLVGLEHVADADHTLANPASQARLQVLTTGWMRAMIQRSVRTVA